VTAARDQVVRVHKARGDSGFAGHIDGLRLRGHIQPALHIPMVLSTGARPGLRLARGDHGGAAGNGSARGQLRQRSEIQ